MSSPAWERQWEIFHELIELGEAERSRRLDALCPDDIELRAEIESLLRAHERTDAVLDRSIEDRGLAAGAFQPAEQVGAFRVGAQIGRGGMGEVFLGERLEGGFRQRVAIKFATAARFSPALLQRFEAERQILSDLDHPGVARLIDGGRTEDGIPYLVMEYVDGQPLDRHCVEKDLSLTKRLELFCEICDAVHFAHTNLVIHRDLKPANILVDAAGRPKLLDFGIAKLLDPGREPGVTAAVLATPEYASPEQLRGQAITTAADIYALGVILFQLLADRHPYAVATTDVEALVREVCERIPPAPSQLTQSRQRMRRLRGDLDRIVQVTLRKEPERRYASARQLAGDIRRHLSGLPILARGESPAYLVGKFVRRHPVGVAASLLGVAALASVAWTNMRQAQALTAALAEARAEQAKAREVTGFLQGLFAVSDPLYSSGGDLPARVLLDQGRERLDVELAEQPGTRAALLVTLGTVYTHLSEFDTAHALLEEAVSLAQQVSGPRDEVLAQIALGRALTAMGRHEEALEPLEAALSLARTLESEDPDLLAEAELRLGRVLQGLARLDEAETQVRRALTRLLALHGESDARVAEGLLLLGGVLWRQGRYEAVQEPYATALAIHAEIFGAGHHRTLQTRTAMGLLMLRLGQARAAVGHFEPVLDGRLESLGPEHALTAESRNHLGAAYYELGRFDDAETQLTLAARTRETLLGPKAQPLARTLNNLALVKQQQRDLEAAGALYARVLEIHRETSGEAHWNYASTLNNLGLVDYDRGDFPLAYERFVEAHGILEALLGADHPSLVYVMTNLGRTLMALGDPDSELWLAQALSLHRAKLDAQNPARADTLTALGELRLQQQRIDDAQRLLEEALTIRRSVLPPGDWRTAETETLHGVVLVYRGEKEAGTGLLKAGHARLEQALGPDHWKTAAAARRLAIADSLPP